MSKMNKVDPHDPANIVEQSREKFDQDPQGLAYRFPNLDPHDPQSLVAEREAQRKAEEFVNPVLPRQSEQASRNTAPASSQPKHKAAQDKGYVHIYAGDGKGKTTAVTGLAVRCAARKWRVLFVQFLKSGTSAELEVLRSLPTVKVVSGQKVNKFTFAMSEEEKKTANAEMQGRLEEAIAQAADYDLLVLDECLGAIATKLISEETVLDFLKHKPRELEVALTGRDPSQRLIDQAHYYSEICMRKHPYESEGLNSRPGIEY